jgi:hypothetical protein
MEFLVFILLFILLDMIALRWGKDTTERLNSSEWANRFQWDKFI